MARPLSEEKQAAILAAATKIIAATGTGATTAAIAKEAGVAAGSLFTYYATKDALLNAVFLALRLEIADAILADYPTEAPPRDRTRHVWNRYIGWALQFPDKRRASDQLALFCRISPEASTAVDARLGPINELAQECIPKHVSMSAEFGSGLMIKLGDLTIEFAEREPDRAELHIAVGFDALWRALSG